jgi:catechol 2,3-dioxygenase-like lactoylglutathione lyase family enzyme
VGTGHAERGTAVTSSADTDAPTVSITGYSHVNLKVDDLDAATTFYTEVLGFTSLPRPDFGERGRGIWLGHGAAQVHLAVVDRVPPRQGFLPHIALHVPAARFAATMTELEARGATFVAPPRSRVDLGKTVWAAFVEDPAGNLIELTDVDPR